MGYRQMQLYLLWRFGPIIQQKMSVPYYARFQERRLRSVKNLPATYEYTEDNSRNILDRQFVAENVNEKWLTDVTGFRCDNGEKLYINVILNLKDNRIVFGRNNNFLVFSTSRLAVEKYPDAVPIFHSDYRLQYTIKIFKDKLEVVIFFTN